MENTRRQTQTLESWFKLTFRLIVGDHWKQVSPIIVGGDTTYRFCREMILKALRELESSSNMFLSPVVSNIKGEIWKLRSIVVDEVSQPTGGFSIWENTSAMAFHSIQSLSDVTEKLKALKLSIVAEAFSVNDSADTVSLKTKMVPEFLGLKETASTQTLHEDVVEAFYIFADYLDEHGVGADGEKTRMGESPKRTSSWQPPESWCFGDFGDNDGQIEYPVDVLVNKQGEFLVLEKNSKGKNTIQRLQLFDKKGRYMKTLLQRGLGGITAMSDMALDNDGNVVVSLNDENGVGRVNVYNMEGDSIQEIDVQIPNPKLPPFFTCVVVDNDNRILVVEHNEMSVHVYERGGKFLFKFGKWDRHAKDGTFDNIYSLDVSEKNEIYACDPFHRVQVFDNNGKYLRSFKPCGIVPSHVIVRENERLVYGVNRDAHALEVFSLDGSKVLKKVGGFGNEIGKLWSPMGIAMTPEGKIAVAERECHRVQVMKL